MYAQHDIITYIRHKDRVMTMNEYRAKIDKNGRVILPVALRRELGVVIGDEIVINVTNEEATMFSIKHALKLARSLTAKYAGKQSLAAALIAARREEAASE